VWGYEIANEGRRKSLASEVLTTGKCGGHCCKRCDLFDGIAEYFLCEGVGGDIIALIAAIADVLFVIPFWIRVWEVMTR
jgi:hypothetical protein